VNIYGRQFDILHRVDGDLCHFAPVPLIHTTVPVDDLGAFNAELLACARGAFSPALLDVPDRRHVHDLGRPPEDRDELWSERQVTPVGIWHRVPTNNVLDLDADPVKRLRAIIEDRYLFALAAVGEIDGSGDVEPWISESWIQVFHDGDDKVLHNHERYGPPYPQHRWAGAYYIDDGRPDPTMPYAGVFSFRVRDANYFVRPRPGLLMIWPADILHEVHPFYGASERVVINFNINASARDGDDPARDR
jgi:hypothetical protein